MIGPWINVNAFTIYARRNRDTSCLVNVRSVRGADLGADRSELPLSALVRHFAFDSFVSQTAVTRFKFTNEKVKGVKTSNLKTGDRYRIRIHNLEEIYTKLGFEPFRTPKTISRKLRSDVIKISGASPIDAKLSHVSQRLTVILALKRGARGRHKFLFLL
jgi:hypothetical protein